MIKLKLFDIIDLDITEGIITSGADNVIEYIDSEEVDNDTLILSTNTHIIFIDNDSLRGIFEDINFEKSLEWADFYETYVDEIYNILVEDLGFNKLMKPRYFETLLEFIYDEIYSKE